MLSVFELFLIAISLSVGVGSFLFANWFLKEDSKSNLFFEEKVALPLNSFEQALYQTEEEKE